MSEEIKILIVPETEVYCEIHYNKWIQLALEDETIANVILMGERGWIRI